MSNIKIDDATQMYNQGQLVIGPPQYQGRKARFMPIIDLRTGESVSLNPISCRTNGSVIPARQFLLGQDIILSDAMRFGMALLAWLKGYEGPDKWALAEDITQFLGEPDRDGNITLTIEVGPYLVETDPQNGRG